MTSKLEKQLIAILQNHCGQRGDNEGAVETLNRIIRERDTARTDANETVEALKVELYDMLEPDAQEIRISAFGIVGREPEKRRVTKAQIARRAGRLVTIESEYEELKDRCLPIPKMEVLNKENIKGGGTAAILRGI